MSEEDQNKNPVNQSQEHSSDAAELSPRPAQESREVMIDKLLWNGGGMGFGICSVASSMMWSMSRPKEPHGADDLKSVVAVSGPPDIYSNEELAALVAFSEERTADYDKMFRWRLGANLICISKFSETSWMRKRLSWEYGEMHSPTLEDALNTFREKLDTETSGASCTYPD